MHVGWQSRSANFKGLFYSPPDWKKVSVDTIATLPRTLFLPFSLFELHVRDEISLETRVTTSVVIFLLLEASGR